MKTHFTYFIIFILSILSLFSNAQSLFGTKQYVNGINYSLGLDVADFNKDGYNDILSEFAFGVSAVINYNNGSGVLETNGNTYEDWIIYSWYYPYAHKYDSDAADFDGDGDIDIVFVSRDSTMIFWYRNDGPYGTGNECNWTGPLDVLSSTGLGTVTDEISFYFDERNGITTDNWDANMDNVIDGNTATFTDDNDLGHIIKLTHNTCDGTILGTITKVELRAHHKNNNSGNPAHRTIAPTLTPIFSGSTGNTYIYPAGDYDPSPGWDYYFDITNDPNAPSDWWFWRVEEIDCILGQNRPDLGRDYVSKIEIKVTYTHYSSSKEKQTTVFTKDIDGDGDNDFITGTTEGTLEWFENDGSGNFTYHTILSSGGSNPQGYQDIYVDDVDEDGDMDFATVTGTGGFFWFENDGSQNFTKHDILSSGGSIGDASRVQICDLDGDGHKDIMFASYDLGVGWSKNNFTAKSSSVFNDTIMLPGHSSSGIHQITYADAADFDSDGDLDIVAGHTDAGALWGVLYYENLSNANFYLRDTISNSFYGHTNNLTSNAYRVRGDDIDNDGVPDLVVATDADVVWFKSNAIPLPIKLLSFTAKNKDKNIELNWKTATETNNDYFVIERSKDAKTFTPISSIDGAGNSNILIKYSTLDQNPLQGTAYYRLKQTDFDGTFSYSNIVAVSTSSTNDNSNIIFSNNILKTSNLNNETYSLNIYDVNGRIVYQKGNITGNQEIDLSFIDKGIYLVKLFSKTNTKTQKIIII